MFSACYPGVRCDVPSAAYQFTFESNTQWSEYYCTGGEIEQYVKRTAYKYGAYKYIKFHSELISGRWNEGEGKWHAIDRFLIRAARVLGLPPILQLASMQT